MKYSSGDTLWYVNPFVFTVEKVEVQMGYKEEDQIIYYIDGETGALLSEHDLFDSLECAVNTCRNHLNKFYNIKDEYIGQIIKDNLEEFERNI